MQEPLMQGTGKWIFGACMTLIALIGLAMASRAVDDVIYFVGLLLFVFGVLMNFWLIGRYVGRTKAH